MEDNESMPLLLVVKTTDDSDLAEAIAHTAVQRGLAACVQIVGPVTSVYRWEGNVETAKEFRCELKTSEQHLGALESLIRELHNYDVPGIIALPLVFASCDYGNWLRQQLKQP